MTQHERTEADERGTYEPPHAESDSARHGAGDSGQEKKWRVAPVRVLIVLAVVYAVYLGVALIGQETFMFPRFVTAPVAERPALPLRTESIWIEPEPGVRVEAWLGMPVPRYLEGGPVPLVVYTHGNGETLDEQRQVIKFYQRQGCAILVPEYRGYGRSGGNPTQAGITADVLAFLDIAVARDEIDGERVVYHGRSIGGGIAGSVAAERAPAGMVLESTFTSMRAMMRRYLVPEPIARQDMETLSTIRGLDIPYLVIHGGSDITVPTHHSRTIVGTLRVEGRDFEYVELEGQDHNSVVISQEPVASAIERLLARAWPVDEQDVDAEAGDE